MRGLEKITDRQILMTIKDLGPVRMSTIAAKLGVTRQAVSYRLQRLEVLKRVSRMKGDRANREPDLWRLHKNEEARQQGEV